MRWLGPLLLLFHLSYVRAQAQGAGNLILNLDDQAGHFLQLTSFPDFSGRRWWVFSPEGERIALSNLRIRTNAGTEPFGYSIDTLLIDSVPVPLFQAVTQGKAKLVYEGRNYGWAWAPRNPAAGALAEVRDLPAKLKAKLGEPLTPDLPAGRLEPLAMTLRFPLETFLREAGYYSLSEYSTLSPAQKIVRFNTDVELDGTGDARLSTNNAARQLHFILWRNACTSLQTLGYLEQDCNCEAPFGHDLFQVNECLQTALDLFASYEGLDPVKGGILTDEVQLGLRRAQDLQNESGQSALLRLGFFNGKPSAEWAGNDSALKALLLFARDRGIPLDTAGFTELDHVMLDSLNKRVAEYVLAAEQLAKLGFPRSKASAAIKAYNQYLHGDSAEFASPVFSTATEEKLNADQAFFKALQSGMEDSTLVRCEFENQVHRIVVRGGLAEYWAASGDSLTLRSQRESARLDYLKVMEARIQSSAHATGTVYLHVQPWTAQVNEGKITAGNHEFLFPPAQLSAAMEGKDSTFIPSLAQWLNTRYNNGEIFIVVMDETMDSLVANKKSDWLGTLGPSKFFESSTANPIVFTAGLSAACGSDHAVYLTQKAEEAAARFQTIATPRAILRIALIKGKYLLKLKRKANRKFKTSIKGFVPAVPKLPKVLAAFLKKNVKAPEAASNAAKKAEAAKKEAAAKKAALKKKLDGALKEAEKKAAALQKQAAEAAKSGAPGAAQLQQKAEAAEKDVKKLGAKIDKLFNMKFPPIEPDSVLEKKIAQFLCADSMKGKSLVLLNPMAAKGMQFFLPLTGPDAAQFILQWDQPVDEATASWVAAKWMRALCKKKNRSKNPAAVFHKYLGRRIAIKWRFVHPFLPVVPKLKPLERTVFWF